MKILFGNGLFTIEPSTLCIAQVYLHHTCQVSDDTWRDLYIADIKYVVRIIYYT